MPSTKSLFLLWSRSNVETDIRSGLPTGLGSDLSRVRERLHSPMNKHVEAPSSSLDIGKATKGSLECMLKREVEIDDTDTDKKPSPRSETRAKEATETDETASEKAEQAFLQRKRQMNIIYSRRKREKKKLQVDTLQAQRVLLQRDNARLAEEGMQLGLLLQEAQLMALQHEQAHGQRTGLLSSGVMNGLGTARPHSMDFGTGFAMNPALISESVSSLPLTKTMRSLAPQLQTDSLGTLPGATGLPLMSGVGSSDLARQLALDQERKRLALLDYSIQQDALRQQNLLLRRSLQQQSLQSLVMLPFQQNQLLGTTQLQPIGTGISSDRGLTNAFLLQRLMTEQRQASDRNAHQNSQQSGLTFTSPPGTSFSSPR